MEVGEAVAVDVLTDANHDDKCFFCNAKDSPKEIENDLEADADEDVEGYGGFKNDASKLGRALGGNPSQQSVEVNGESLPVTVAAHHLIPGNASLKKSDLFRSEKYLWLDGKQKGNIGYNINSSANGVWLPGNYAIKGWSGKSADFKQRYSHAAIRGYGAQFHDAHEKYSKFVLSALQKVHEKIEDVWGVQCPLGKQRQQQGSSPADRPPLTALVGRLNMISFRMREMLEAPSTNWKKNVFTSSRSSEFMQSQPHLGTDGGGPKPTPAPARGRKRPHEPSTSPPDSEADGGTRPVKRPKL